MVGTNLVTLSTVFFYFFTKIFCFITNKLDCCTYTEDKVLILTCPQIPEKSEKWSFQEHSLLNRERGGDREKERERGGD